ncbi:MAG: hypothetical protein AB7O67_16710 [Vicinamibacterales bacterium]
MTLQTIGGGALAELFAAELARVLENIADPNTDPKTKRTITIAVTFKPGRDRDAASVEIKCGSKLAGILTVNTQLFMGRQAGKLIAVENDPRQTNLFDPERPPLSAVSQFPQQQKDGE